MSSENDTIKVFEYELQTQDNKTLVANEGSGGELYIFNYFRIASTIEYFHYKNFFFNNFVNYFIISS